MYFIIQKDDIKTAYWAENSVRYGVQLVAQRGSPIKAPAFFIKQIFTRGRPFGYVVRYLNDYPSLYKTLIRLFSELTLILLCQFLRVPIFWICHNVDRESIDNYPHITSYRRNLFSRKAKQVFVTDPLLVRMAVDNFPGAKGEIRSISFGKYYEKYDSNREDEAAAIECIQNIRSESEGRVFVVFCVGSIGRKFLHFDKISLLQKTARKAGYRILAVVAGPFDDSASGRRLANELSANPDVVLFRSYTRFSDDFVRDYVDMYWRAYDDWSVPFTVYEAATLKKPMLALNTGFLPTMVNAYDLGQVIEMDMSNVGFAIEAVLSNFSPEACDRFLETHTWATLAEQLSLQEQ